MTTAALAKAMGMAATAESTVEQATITTRNLIVERPDAKEEISQATRAVAWAELARAEAKTAAAEAAADHSETADRHAKAVKVKTVCGKYGARTAVLPT